MSRNTSSNEYDPSQLEPEIHGPVLDRDRIGPEQDQTLFENLWTNQSVSEYLIRAMAD